MIFNDTHKEKLFYSTGIKIYWNTSLAASELFHVFTKSTRDATRCNNCDDLLRLRPLYKGDLYITQSNIYDEALIAKIVNR